MSPLLTLPPETLNLVVKAFQKSGPERLKQVFDGFDGKIGYEELKAARLYYISQYNIDMNQTMSLDPDHVYRDIVCLANSRKYSGRCIAGKEISGNVTGQWIRPVSQEETGELTLKDIILRDYGHPELLDILSIPLEKHDPHLYQSENHIIGSGEWRRKGKMSASHLKGLRDDPGYLWINGHHSYTGQNDRMPLKEAEERLSSSLLLIKPESLNIIVDKGARLLKKIRAGFEFKGTGYVLSITDPLIEETYLKKDFGIYPVDGHDNYLCVSIGEPYEGYCYKLVAGIIAPKD